MKNDDKTTRAITAGALAIGSAALIFLGGCRVNGNGESVETKRSEAKPALTVTIETAAPCKVGDGLTLNAVFENRGTAPATIIIPQDGSFEGWLSPTYRVTLTKRGDADPPGPMGRCGNHGAIYDERTMKSVAPGESITVKLMTSHLFTAAGKFSVDLTYEVKPDAYPGPRYDAPSMEQPKFGAWPAGVFVGTIASNEIEIDVAK